MADVSVRIELELNQKYEGEGRPLVDEVDAALTAAVDLIREVCGLAVDRGGHDG